MKGRNIEYAVPEAYGRGYSDGYKKALEFLAKQKEFKESVQVLARRAMDVWHANESPLSESDGCVLFNSIVDTFEPFILDKNNIIREDE